jgi:hypothetical protein
MITNFRRENVLNLMCAAVSSAFTFFESRESVIFAETVVCGHKPQHTVRLAVPENCVAVQRLFNITERINETNMDPAAERSGGLSVKNAR